jgi:hypothetical protein
MTGTELELTPPVSARSRPLSDQAPENKRNSEPPDVGCYERGASRRQAAHGSEAAAAGNTFGSLAGERRLRPRRLSAKV